MQIAISAVARYDEAVATAAEAESVDAAPVAEPTPPVLLDLGREASEALSATGALPDQVIVGLVVHAISTIDPVSYSGFILDGFPKTLAQACPTMYHILPTFLYHCCPN